MKYKTHRLEFNMNTDQHRLDQFLNNLEGKVISIIPNNKNISLLQIYGITRKIDFLLITEKISKV